jgi:succinate dehydrogenase / fumarate reductase cytochrome b subunit
MSDTHSCAARPKYLNLMQIRLPVTAKASILHRVSGAGLFILLPFFVWLVQQSLASAEGYAAVGRCLAHPLTKLVLTGALWAFFHHVCMGVRILLIDIHVGVAKEQATRSAVLVFVVSLVLTLVFGLKLWGIW